MTRPARPRPTARRGTRPGDPVGDLLHLGHDVRGHEDRLSGIAGVTDRWPGTPDCRAGSGRRSARPGPAAPAGGLSRLDHTDLLGFGPRRPITSAWATPPTAVELGQVIGEHRDSDVIPRIRNRCAGTRRYPGRHPARHRRLLVAGPAERQFAGRARSECRDIRSPSCTRRRQPLVRFMKSTITSASRSPASSCRKCPAPSIVGWSSPGRPARPPQYGRHRRR